MGMLPPI
jgi:sialic acid synthase SpsE